MGRGYRRVGFCLPWAPRSRRTAAARRTSRGKFTPHAVRDPDAINSPHAATVAGRAFARYTLIRTSAVNAEVPRAVISVPDLCTPVFAISEVGYLREESSVNEAAHSDSINGAASCTSLNNDDRDKRHLILAR